MAADRAARLKRRLLVGLIVVVVAAAVGASVVQWFRPLARPELRGWPLLFASLGPNQDCPGPPRARPR